MNVHYDNERIKSHNLYQLFSYLINQKDGSEKSKSAKGILVYPTVSREYNLSFSYDQHILQIKTLNLNDKWDKIADRLKDIIK
jgi:5-methylcytosine-specific restriction enzyme subunit McrC